MVRMQPRQLKALDRWIGKTDISRPEAVRQLVDWAMAQIKKLESPMEAPPPRRVERAKLEPERAYLSVRRLSRT
jgi:hypothetical protein